MSALRLIEPLALQRLQGLLYDDSVAVQPITVQYENYIMRNKTQAPDKPLRFLWWRGPQVETLFFALNTRDSKASRATPGAHLVIAKKDDDRIVGYLLSQMPQDDEHVFLSFRLGNGEGGNNRWFGRGRAANDRRSATAMTQLAADLRQAWQPFFPLILPQHPTLPGEWLVLAKLPLADLDPQAIPARRVVLKTLILEKLAHAFVIAEKVRDNSLNAAKPTDEDSATKLLPVPIAMNHPLNQILYGPPGTGKTYHTAVRAVGLLEGLPDDEVASVYPSREDLRHRYDEYQQAGRIQFVTFHQAFSYEDFVEGIKPLPPAKTNPDEADAPLDGPAPGLQYAIEAGVFKRLCETAAAAATPEELAPTIPFGELYDGFVAQLKQQLVTTSGPLTFQTKEGRPVMLVSVDKGLPGRLSFHHSTPTGQGHNQDKSWIEKIYSKYSSIDQITHLKKHLTDTIGGTNASLQYVVFRELKKYEAQRLTEERRKLQVQPAPRFVLIIDEINRGNVANIFGELITLLEDDKRAGRPEALTVKLPYSKEDFTVPDNLYLLGTMNTADRSVEALDTALRRRFSFHEMRPDADVIRAQANQGIIGEGAAAIDVARLLETLNSRLEQLLDRDHCLGHALLLRATTLADLQAAFARNILPLLQEYFFGDWGKIGLVLGDRFVAAEKPAVPLAKFPGHEAASLRDKRAYRLHDVAELDAAAFRGIYQPAPAATS